MGIILVPAYCRSYETLEEVKKEFYGGKDFKIYQGPYCSERDAINMIKEFGLISILYGIEKDLSYNIDLNEYNSNHTKVIKSKYRMVRIPGDISYKLTCLKTSELNSFPKVINMLLESFERTEKTNATK